MLKLIDCSMFNGRNIGGHSSKETLKPQFVVDVDLNVVPSNYVWMIKFPVETLFKQCINITCAFADNTYKCE